MRTDTGPCDGVTGSARLCRRRARFLYLDASGRIVARYCAQHHDGRGPSRLLRPYPWTYSRIIDVTGR